MEYRSRKIQELLIPEEKSWGPCSMPCSEHQQAFVTNSNSSIYRWLVSVDYRGRLLILEFFDSLIHVIHHLAAVSRNINDDRYTCKRFPPATWDGQSPWPYGHFCTFFLRKRNVHSKTVVHSASSTRKGGRLEPRQDTCWIGDFGAGVSEIDTDF